MLEEAGLDQKDATPKSAHGGRVSVVPAAAHLSAHWPSRSNSSADFVRMRAVASRESFIREMLYFIQFAKVLTRASFRLYGNG